MIPDSAYASSGIKKFAPTNNVSHASVMCVLYSSGLSGLSSVASGDLSFSNPFLPTFTAVCSMIGERSCVSSADVKAVLDSLIYVMKLEMSDGKIVQLGEFGNFRITFGSEGTKVEKDFNATKIRRPKYTFSPGKALRSQAKVLRFEKVSVEKGEGGNDSESPDEI